jgi:hypothetical protein
MRNESLITQFMQEVSNLLPGVGFSQHYDESLGFHVIKHSYSRWNVDEEFKSKLNSLIMNTFVSNSYFDYAVLYESKPVQSYLGTWLTEMGKINPHDFDIQNISQSTVMVSTGQYKEDRPLWKEEVNRKDCAEYGKAA